MKTVRISREEDTDVPNLIEQHPRDPSFAHPAQRWGYTPRPTTLRNIRHAPLATLTVVAAALYHNRKCQN
jgi:hypothetical protein